MPWLYVLELPEVRVAAHHLKPLALRVDVDAHPGDGLATVARVADATPYHPPVLAILDVEAGGNLVLCSDHETKLAKGWLMAPGRSLRSLAVAKFPR
jgi:hypothetical protein